jgi:hypothetical protein
MWDTFFALALAASVCFGAANLAVQLNHDRTAVKSLIESRQPLPNTFGRSLSAAEPENGAQSGSQLD